MDRLIEWIRGSGATFRPIPLIPATPDSPAILGGWVCNRQMPSYVLKEAQNLSVTEVLQAAEMARN